MESNLKYTIKKIIVRRVVKVSTGSYQNTDIDVSLEATCSAKEDVGKISDILFTEIDKILAPRIKMIKGANPIQFAILSESKEKK